MPTILSRTILILGCLLALTCATLAAEDNPNSGGAPMETYQDQADFFKQHWPAMKDAAEAGGSAGVIGFIAGFDDELQRRVLYAFARMGLAMEDYQGKSFDLLIEVADAGIAEFMAQSEAAEDAETKAKRIDGANMISFNLAADLADCWPGDEAQREPRHFERGLKAAEDCIRWREELKKPPGPRSMAWWAKGMHQLSLGRPDATASFARSLEYAQQAAKDEGSEAEVGAGSTFAVILGAGYLGLALEISGQEGGQELYDEAIRTFKVQLEDEATKEDAQFGIDQLEVVKGKYVK